MALPSLEVTGRFNFDAIRSMLYFIPRELAARNHVWVTIVVAIFGQCFAVFWYSRSHEFTDNTAKIGCH